MYFNLFVLAKKKKKFLHMSKKSSIFAPQNRFNYERVEMSEMRKCVYGGRE